MIALSNLWNSIQSWLFPALEEELGELTEKQQGLFEFASFVILISILAHTNGNIAAGSVKNVIPKRL